MRETCCEAACCGGASRRQSALVGSSIAREASAAIDREIFEQTVSNCMRVTLGQASVDAVSISIASLVKGALSAMIVEKVKWAGIAVFAVGVALAGAAVMARQGGGQGGGGFGGTIQPPARPKSPARNPALVDNRLEPVDSDSESDRGEGAKTADTANAELEDLRSRLIQAARRDWTVRARRFPREQGLARPDLSGVAAADGRGRGWKGLGGGPSCGERTCGSDAQMRAHPARQSIRDRRARFPW